MTGLNYTCTGMIILELPNVWNYYKSVYFYGHIGFISIFILGRFVLPSKSPKSQKS